MPNTCKRLSRTARKLCWGWAAGLCPLPFHAFSSPPFAGGPFLCPAFQYCFTSIKVNSACFTLEEQVARRALQVAYYTPRFTALHGQLPQQVSLLPSPCARPSSPPSGRYLSAAPVPFLNPVPRRVYPDPGPLPPQFYIAPKRPYLIRQAQGSFPRSFPWCPDKTLQMTVLCDCTSKMCSHSEKVKVSFSRESDPPPFAP